jgi:hypothetical protein
MSHNWAVGRGWVMRATNGMEQYPDPWEGGGKWLPATHEKSDEGLSGERAVEHEQVW